MAILKTLQDGIDEIRKLYGTASVFLPNDNFKSNIQSVGTGSFNLNDTIGVGGIPCGRVTMLSGIESSGKSLAALSIIKEAQKEGGIGYYIDGEFTFDPEWTQRLGVDLEKIIISQTNNAKEVFELLLGKPKNDKRKQAISGILTNEKLLQAGLKVVVIDSVDSLVPPMEMDSEVGKANMALMARFLPPELRRLTPILSKTNIAVIAIMQARSVPGQSYGDALTVSGGRALKHAASVWIDLGIVGGSAITIGDKEDGEKIGHKIRAKIRKNKVAPPFKVAEFTILFQKGIDIRPEIPEQAIQTGVIVKESERIYTYGDFRWNGMSSIVEEITKNKDLLKEIAIKVRDAKKKENEKRLADTSFKETEESEMISDSSGAEELEENGLVEGRKNSPNSVKNELDTQKSGDADIQTSEKKVEESQKSSDSSIKNSDSSNDEELENKTLAELKEMAKAKKIPNFYKLTNKQSLINTLKGGKND